MHRKEGFIGLVMLSIMVAISATALLWWHSVDLGLRLVKEKEKYYQARYCAELVLQDVAQALAADFTTWLHRACKNEKLVLSGHISWRYADKDAVLEVRSMITAEEHNKVLIICTTLSWNGCVVTMKGLLHLSKDGGCILDHVTLGNFV